MADKVCMYTTQGELRCCPKNEPSCFYDFAAPSMVTKNQIIESVKKPVVIDEQSLLEKFTKHAPAFEYFQNQPAGLMSGIISTCSGVPGNPI